MHTHKQSTVTSKVFVLWLCNQHYYTRDAIAIKMTHRDLSYYEGIRVKTCHEHKLHEENHTNPLLHIFLENGGSQFILSSHT